MSVANYFGLLQPLDALATYNHILGCRCGKYPPPTLDSAYQAMSNTKTLRWANPVSGDRDDVMALAIRIPPVNRRLKLSDKSKWSCRFCSLNGLDESTCFANHGYPEWWNDHTKGSGHGGGRGTRLGSAAQPTGGAGRGGSALDQAVNCSRPGQTLVVALGMRFGWLGLELCLRVRIVPAYMVTHLFLCRISDDFKSMLQFNNSSCVIHDRTLRILIRVGEQRVGLYYLWDVATVRACLSDGQDMVDLRHKRLGHPSEKVLRYLHGKKGWKVFDFDSCVFFVSRDVKFYENEFPFVVDTSLPNELPTCYALPEISPVCGNEMSNDGSPLDAVGCPESAALSLPNSGSHLPTEEQPRTGAEQGAGRAELHLPGSPVLSPKNEESGVVLSGVFGGGWMGKTMKNAFY
ncbi:hypothetical protein LIER_30026 [Lithospermum erythrorhizon]|uniref:Retroviral polymerase SH3-like domain-containing protein n=1 Tax=Lithospermum erythrorhizon TaxID=34254 RepID=A0AAV3RQ71_LITER